MPGTPANAAVPSTTSWLGYWCTIARRCFSVSRSCAFVTSRNACSASLALGALRRTRRGAERRVQSPRLRERGRVARAGACPAPRAKKDELSLVLFLVLVWFAARIFRQHRRLWVRDPRSDISFRSEDIFPVPFPARQRFALDTPGTPAFDSVSRVCALSPGIPAISFFIGSAWRFDRKGSILKGACTHPFIGTPIDTRSRRRVGRRVQQLSARIEHEKTRKVLRVYSRE